MHTITFIVEESESKCHTTVHRQAMVMWTLFFLITVSPLEKWHAVTLSMWRKAACQVVWPFRSSCGGMHAKRCFNRLQKHWMCVVQITGSKNKRSWCNYRGKKDLQYALLFTLTLQVKRGSMRFTPNKITYPLELYQKWSKGLATGHQVT